jgi:RNA polymerase sigma-70 factor (ECF subfamily)
MTPEDELDLALMGRARDGDPEAFALLHQRHRRRLERFLYRLFWDRDKAEDGAQEVFLRLWAARHRYQRQARFTTFLYQVAYNFWLDEGRKTRVRPVEVSWAEGEGPDLRPRRLVPHAPAATEPHYQLFLHYEQWRIRAAITRLPEGCRLVFVLAHLEERKLTEIAEILGIPLGTVKSRMHTAVRLLRGWLSSDEGETEP